MAKRKSGAADDDPIRRQHEIDTYDRDYLRQFYERRRSDIMQSGDTIRIRLLSEHDERERKR